MFMRIDRLVRLRSFVLVLLFILPGCLGESEEESSSENGSVDSLEVWYTFAAETLEEEIFLDSVASFTEETGIEIKATRVPYDDAVALFIIAAQGGEAPDLIRISSDNLDKFGEVRVDGFPLFEDLRPHLTPEQRSNFDPISLQSMLYEDSLYAVPASYDCLSLIYNKDLFSGIEEPNEDWTLEDLKNAGQQVGLEFPVKNAYWWFSFFGGYGGELFDENGTPTLDVNGAESLEWMMDLELEHEIVPTGTQITTMEDSFEAWDTGMIIDGPWNWVRYGKGIENLGQTLLPKVSENGDHLSPLVTYKGWAVSKQSPGKVAATNLALYLSSDEVQKEFALQTYTIPSSENLKSDPDILADPVISGFIDQAEVGTPAPTTYMSLVYEALAPQFENVYTGALSAEDALEDADEQLEIWIDEKKADSPEKAELIEGYRTAEIEFEIGEGNHSIFMDGELHSILTKGDTSFDIYTGCLSSYSNESSFSCSITGLIPNQEHEIVVNDSTGIIYQEIAISSVEDILPEPRGTSGVLFAIGSIILSLIALLSYGAWKDKKKASAKGAHFYIAPALMALAVLTFYPVFYGFYLSITDSNRTRLGDESIIGFSNFIEVFAAEGFLQVTLFTLVWTLTNVIAHIGIGLFLALILNDKRIKGRVAYRTIMLLPWAIPSYISVLIWRGVFEPGGLLNDLLGTDLNLLADPTGAQIVVILVNIWLGVPFMMMSLSGALQSIPREMYEAADVDGVSNWDQFRHLTLPNLKSALIPLSLLGFIWTFNMFNVIYLMTDGGPNLTYGPGSTDILITYVYDVAFIKGQYGLAAAWSVVIFAMLVVFSWLYMKQTNATEAVS